VDEKPNEASATAVLQSGNSEKLNQVELDQALLYAYRAGDAQALKTLVELHYANTICWAKKYSAEDDSEDLAQQAVLKMIEALAKGAGPRTSVGLYLATTVRNLVVNLRTAKSRCVPVPEVDDLVFGTRVEYLPDDSILTEALGTLGKRDQQLLWWRDVEMIPPREIAQLLDMTPAAVSMAHSRAVTALGMAYRRAAVRYGLDAGEKPKLPRISKTQHGLPIAGAVGLLGGACVLGSQSVSAPAAAAAAVSSKALPVTLASLGAVAVLTAGVIYATSQPAAVVFSVPGSGGQSEVVVHRVLDAQPDSNCTLNWHPDGWDANGQAHFHLVKVGQVACSLTVAFGQEGLASIDDAPSGAIVVTAKPGDYEVYLDTRKAKE
jgi:RNA polymerase sigma factor (sigma-70 family)